MRFNLRFKLYFNTSCVRDRISLSLLIARLNFNATYNFPKVTRKICRQLFIVDYSPCERERFYLCLRFPRFHGECIGASKRGRSRYAIYFAGKRRARTRVALSRRGRTWHEPRMSLADCDVTPLIRALPDVRKSPQVKDANKTTKKKYSEENFSAFIERHARGVHLIIPRRSAN